ncbi:MAG: hypothetical protein J0I34_19450 [Pseudonocardia sp.]|uniref:hypothetical protein n=1 Tax=unclassified Pseudonocardia TaxID=2619320 RepID=UPI00086DB1C0|nr:MULTISPECIES: hypothetical protein [unclassified Pseudonocardia]MBN9110944.1 hypothetical protein [Pseudonocardia sp.]ODU25045.1 MAG: hypothetical protein ABS80_10895 [Pseudonocardia sp. SCN 72-51]ODV04999.1 MAG: hypothetical protein ABT15_18555 [Pseudonocardia sp. SCN 73-27]
MPAAPAVAVALTFVWLGMVLAISFLEAPLKFRAPDVTIRIGLGIGRLVFTALNAVETVLAAGLVVTAVIVAPPTTAAVAGAVAVAVLLIQLAAVRPRLTRRSNAVLAGAGSDAPRSHAHLVYVAFEIVKVAALVVAGVALLAG